MPKERLRNEDARGGDVLVNDSIASGKPDLPIDRDPGRETSIGIDADQLGAGETESGGSTSQTTPPAEGAKGERVRSRVDEETLDREHPNRGRRDRQTR